MISGTYGIESQWWADELAPQVVGTNLLDTLDQLAPLDPAMSHWLLLDRVSYEYLPIEKARPDITAFVEHNVWEDDEGPDPREGYGLVVMGSTSGSEFGTSQSINISITSGSIWRNDLSFKVGGGYNCPPDPALVTYSIYRGALETLAANWPCPWLLAYA